MANKRSFWKSKQGKAIKHSVAYNMLRLTIALAPLIPRYLGVKIFAFLGGIVGKYLKQERNKAHGFLLKVFAESKSELEREKIIDKMFQELGITLFDAICIPQLKDKQYQKYVSVEDANYYDGIDPESGIVVLSGHSSCFELQTQITARKNLKTVTVGSPFFDATIDKILTKLRSRNGVLYLHRDKAGRKLYKVLKEGYLFGALIDQDTMKEGVFAPFLGELAFTPTGPITLAYKLNLPILFQYMYRDEKQKYRIILKRFFYGKSDNKELDIASIVKEFNLFYSKEIEAHPEQWVWLHNRWKRKPEDMPNTTVIA